MKCSIFLCEPVILAHLPLYLCLKLHGDGLLKLPLLLARVEESITQGLDLFYLRLGVGFKRLCTGWLRVEVDHLSLDEVLFAFLAVGKLLPVLGLLLNGLRLLLALLDLLLQSLQLGLILLLNLPRLELRVGCGRGPWLGPGVFLRFSTQERSVKWCVLGG